MRSRRTFLLQINSQRIIGLDDDGAARVRCVPRQRHYDAAFPASALKTRCASGSTKHCEKLQGQDSVSKERCLKRTGNGPRSRAV